MKRRFLLPLLALALPVSAQADDNRFTLESILETAHAQNLGLKVTTEGIVNAKATEQAAFRGMLPSFSLKTLRQDTIRDNDASIDESEFYATTLSVNQPIYQGNALHTAWKSAQVDVDRARWAEERKRRELTQEVKAGWYALLKAKMLFRVARESLDRLKEHEKNARLFFAEGQIWRNDVLQAQVESARGEQELIAAENDYELAKSTLNQLMRRDIGTPLIPEGELPGMQTPEIAAWSLQEALESARANRQDLMRSEAEIEQAEQSLEIAKADMRPTLDLDGTLKVTALEEGYDKSDSEAKVLLTLNWDFWQWGATLKSVEAAKSDVTTAELTYREEIDSVMVEAQTAWLGLREAKKKVAVLQQALTQAEENYRVSQIRYQEKLGTATDVLDAQELLTETRSDEISARADYFTALADLELAVGVANQAP